MSYWREYQQKNKDKITARKKQLDLEKLEFLCRKGYVSPFALDFIKRTRR